MSTSKQKEWSNQISLIRSLVVQNTKEQHKIRIQMKTDVKFLFTYFSYHRNVRGRKHFVNAENWIAPSGVRIECDIKDWWQFLFYLQKNYCLIYHMCLQT